jgi:hypothetical protein
MAPVFYKVNSLGLIPAIWTSPFEISERSWVYQNHPDWLVKNAEGKPIHAGSVVDGKDPLFVLDVTNPDAAAYLHKTYSTMADVWGIRSIKLDFMDDTAIEGYYYKAHTTALEAQRIGLRIIRDAVGEKVYLDKDGSPMLNPVGLVDYGRISQDTGHTFGASKEAEPGIAARYYMNRNYFVADPDAFTVSTQTIRDQTWHESDKPATLDEASVSISLAAVSGGMFEIGDNLPSLTNEPERLALIENPDLLNMIRLGKASVPMDLMSYSAEDGQPSIFLLKEDPRQTILTIFNWTDGERRHSIDLASIGPASGGPAPRGHYAVTDVLSAKRHIALRGMQLDLQLPAHSVRVLKVVDTQMPAEKPEVDVESPSSSETGATLTFAATEKGTEPVLSYTWDFGDGVTQDGAHVQHAYTEPGDYVVRLVVCGVDGLKSEEQSRVHVTGHLPTTFDPGNIHRYSPTE